MEREHGIIERGKILEVKETGYIIASYDRDGIITPPLRALDDNKSYSEGDMVYYFIFRDGSGRVIERM